MSEDLVAVLDKLSPPPQRGRARARRVLVALSDGEHATIKRVARRLRRPLAEVVRGLALIAASWVER